MQHYSSTALTDIGKPAGGANITVRVAGTLTNASIFSDDGVTLKSNPFTANNLGQFDFYAASGKYDITITGAAITAYTLTSQVIFDPFEAVAQDTPVWWSGNVALNTTGQGGMWAVSIAMPRALGAFPVVNAANEVRVFQFVLPYKVIIGRVSVLIFTGSPATGDVGIYDINGNRLLYTGGFSTASSGPLSTPVVGGPITLNPGFYYFAQTNSSIQPLWIVSGGLSGTQDSQLVRVFNASGTKGIGLAANSAAGGVLPGTLGVITSDQAVPENAVAVFER